MISLSTAQPSVGGSAPSLPTRIVRFKRPKPRPQPRRAEWHNINEYVPTVFDQYDPTIVSNKVPLVIY